MEIDRRPEIVASILQMNALVGELGPRVRLGRLLTGPGISAALAHDPTD